MLHSLLIKSTQYSLLYYIILKFLLDEYLIMHLSVFLIFNFINKISYFGLQKI